MEAIVSPPRTAMEVFKLLPEGSLAEVIENNLYMSPTPITPHQRMVRKLLVKLDAWIEEKSLGEVFIAPFDVYLDEHTNAVQPDIIYVSNENSTIVDEESTIHGVPDLLIEILSPGNRNYDLEIKKNLYEKFGVKEYWAIDPLTKEVLGYFLIDGKYLDAEMLKGKIASKLLSKTFIF
ncbi:MAG: Uma2 family endonuclease [bacterium]